MEDLRAEGDEIDGDEDRAKGEEDGPGFADTLPAGEGEAHDEERDRIEGEDGEAGGAAEGFALVGNEDDGGDGDEERARIEQEIGLAFRGPPDGELAEIGAWRPGRAASGQVSLFFFRPRRFSI